MHEFARKVKDEDGGKLREGSVTAPAGFSEARWEAVGSAKDGRPGRMQVALWRKRIMPARATRQEALARSSASSRATQASPGAPGERSRSRTAGGMQSRLAGSLRDPSPYRHRYGVVQSEPPNGNAGACAAQAGQIASHSTFYT